MANKQELCERCEEAAMYLRSNHDIDVCYVALRGSQNYGLDTAESDVDLVAVYIPTLHHLITGTNISTCIPFKGGIIEVMDVRKWADVLCRLSHVQLETLVTPYYWAKKRYHNKFEYIRSLVDKLIKQDELRFAQSVCGHFRQCVIKASSSPKKAYHAYRLYYLLKDWFETHSFHIYLDPALQPKVMDIKMGAEVQPESIALLMYKMDNMLENAKENSVKHELTAQKQLNDAVYAMIVEFVLYDEEVE